MRMLRAAVLLIVVAALTAGPATAHPWGGYHRDTCSGEAPVAATCTTGLHFRFNGDPVLRHGFSGVGSSYTGTLVSRLVYLGGERAFTCDYVSGAIVGGCRGSGDFPPFQSYFTQICESRAPGTTTPGGSGTWGCFMEHG